MTIPVTALQSLPASSFLKIINDPAMRVSFGQLGEDIIVYHLLVHYAPPLERGFYVDVGAHHPRQLSNTQFLHLLGWNGINVDANEESIKLFKQERPNAVNLHMGVGLVPGTLPFYQFQSPAFNTFSEELAVRWKRDFNLDVIRTDHVPVRPLNDILAEHVPQGQRVDFLNIDVEGLDQEVALSLDLTRFRPKILCLELHDADILALGKAEVIAHFVQHGYKLKGVTFASHILVDA